MSILTHNLLLTNRLLNMYSEHTIEPENRIELGYKGKREHIVMPNVQNLGYPGQTIEVSIP